MNLFVDPISASVTGWQVFGKVMEQQLRVGQAMNQAFLAPFCAPPLKTKVQPPHDIPGNTGQRADVPAANPKPAPRTTKAKATIKKAAASTAMPKTVPTQTSAEQQATTTAAVGPEVRQPVARPAATKSAPEPKKKKTAQAAAPTETKPRRRVRQPSKPPVMPSATKE